MEDAGDNDAPGFFLVGYYIISVGNVAFPGLTVWHPGPCCRQQRRQVYALKQLNNECVGPVGIIYCYSLVNVFKICDGLGGQLWRFHLALASLA